MADNTKLHVYVTRKEKRPVEDFISEAKKLAGGDGQSQVVMGSDLRWHGDLMVSVGGVDHYVQDLAELVRTTNFVVDKSIDRAYVRILDGQQAEQICKL